MKNSRKAAPPLRVISGARYSFYWFSWAAGFVLLLAERPAARMHVRWVIAVRHAANRWLGSNDAAPNIEHALSGVMIAFACVLIVHGLPYASRAIPPTPMPQWKLRVRERAFACLRVAFRLIGPLIDQAGHRGQRLASAVRDRKRLLQFAVVALPLLAMVLAWGTWAYGLADLALMPFAVLGLSLLAYWPRATLRFLSEWPALGAGALALPIWLHFEVLWKCERVVHHIVTPAHALRHCAISAGACVAVIGACHLLASIRGVPRAAAAGVPRP